MVGCAQEERHKQEVVVVVVHDPPPPVVEESSSTSPMTRTADVSVVESLLQSLPYDYTFVLDAKILDNQNGGIPTNIIQPSSFLYGCPQWTKFVGDNVLNPEVRIEFVRLCRLVTTTEQTNPYPLPPLHTKKQVELFITFQETASHLQTPEHWDMTLFPVFEERAAAGTTVGVDKQHEESRLVIGVAGLITRSIKANNAPKDQVQTGTTTSATHDKAVDPDEEESSALSGQYLRQLVDSAATISALLDRHGTVLECSSSFAAKFVSQQDDKNSLPVLLRSNLWEHATRSDLVTKLKNMVAQVLENHSPAKAELKHNEAGPATTDKWMEYTVSAVAVSGKDETRVVLVEGRDITEQIHCENKYKETIQYYRGIFHLMPLGYSLMESLVHEDGRKDYKFIDVNAHFEKMTGLSRKASVNNCAREVLPGIEDDPADWIGRVCRVTTEGEPDEFTQFSVPLQKWYKGIMFSPLPGKAICLFMDISDQEEKEQALRESEERHLHLFETMKQGVSYASADGSYSDANEAALGMLGLTIDQFQGRTSIDPRWNTIREDGSIWPSEDHPVNHVFKTGKPIENAVMGVFNPVEEEYRWLSIDLFPCFRPGESLPYRCCNIFSDITETRQLESTLLKAKEAAEEADKLKSAFLATMSHEIRTPLNGLMGHLDLVLSNGLEEEHKEENLEGLKYAMQSGKLLISIIEDILDLSKIEAGQLDISHDSFSISGLIDQTMQLARAYQIQRKKGHVELRQEVAEFPSAFAYGDEFRLQQILCNLISNAIKFTSEGFVSLTVTHDDSKLSFCVQDTGKGIPEEKLGVIFDPFRQVELSDTREQGGTGLGLTICRKLVELMGGTLTVESQVSGPEHGSKFFVKIPYEAAHDKPLTRGHNSRSNLQSLDSVSSQLDKGRSLKILVAEDDPISRRVVSKMLEKAGQEVLIAKDGLQAVEMYGKHRHEIALTLMDVMMPGIDGLEASKRIRHMEARENVTHSVPIIALSAGAMKGDREKGIEFGMTDYLTKPISYKALLTTLETYLGEPSSATN